MTANHDKETTRDQDASPAGGQSTESGKPRQSAGEAYQTVAETVGLIPSLRRKDNLIQGLVVGLGTLLGAALGCLFGHGLVSRIEAFTGIRGIAETHGPRLAGALFGAAAGLVLSAMASGLALMLLGWRRLARRRSS